MNTGQTGPKTGQGKSRAAQNSLKHGLSAKNLIVQPGEEQDLEALHQGLRAEIRPKGCLEETLFARLLHAAWNAYRIKALEAALFHNGDPFLDPELGKGLDRLMRYQRLHDRAYQTALNQLRIQQTLRLTTERIHPAIRITPDEPLPITADTAKIQRALARTEASLRKGTAPGFTTAHDAALFAARPANNAPKEENLKQG